MRIFEAETCYRNMRMFSRLVVASTFHTCMYCMYVNGDGVLAIVGNKINTPACPVSFSPSSVFARLTVRTCNIRECKLLILLLDVIISVWAYSQRPML